MQERNGTDVIKIENRVAEHAGRVKLTEVSEGIFDLERADEAMTEGTPLNARTGEQMQGDVRILETLSGEGVNAYDVVDYNEENVFITRKSLQGEQVQAATISKFGEFYMYEFGQDKFVIPFLPSSGSDEAMIWSVVDKETGALLARKVTSYAYSKYGHDEIALSDTIAVAGSNGHISAMRYENGTITLGDVAKPSGTYYTKVNQCVAMVRLSETQFLYFSNYTSSVYARVCTVSPDTLAITWGTQFLFSSKGISGYARAKMLGNGKVLLTWCGLDGAQYGCVFVVDGAVVTCGEPIMLCADTTASKMRLAEVGENQAVTIYYKSGVLYTAVLSVSDMTVSLSGETPVASGEIALPNYKLCKLSDTYFMSAHMVTGSGKVILSLLKKEGDHMHVCDMFEVFSATVLGMGFHVQADDEVTFYYCPATASFCYTKVIRFKDKIGGSFYNGSNMAVALTGAEDGEKAKLLISGTAAFDMASLGDEINTDNIWGTCPRDGFLTVYPQKSKGFVSGSFIGDGTAERLVMLGFEPCAVSVYPAITAASSTTIKNGLALRGAPLTIDTETVLQTEEYGFSVYEGTKAKTNSADTAYYYIAYR